jgi:DNA-binding response OmpR family regulator
MDLKLLKNLNVLHVEDDIRLAESMGNTLGLFFKRTYHAPNGARAFEMLDKLPVHVVFLDIRLPDTDGLSVAEGIRKKDPDIPLVVMSSYQDISELRRAASLFLTDYLIKPVALETLETVLKKCLAQLNMRGRLLFAMGAGAYYDSIGKIVSMPDGRAIRMSRREALFLELLLKRPGNLVPMDRIAAVVYNHDMSMAALRNMVLRLRQKLGGINRIECAREIGYLWQ